MNKYSFALLCDPFSWRDFLNLKLKLKGEDIFEVLCRHMIPSLPLPFSYHWLSYTHTHTRTHTGLAFQQWQAPEGGYWFHPLRNRISGPVALRGLQSHQVTRPCADDNPWASADWHGSFLLTVSAPHIQLYNEVKQNTKTAVSAVPPGAVLRTSDYITKQSRGHPAWSPVSLTDVHHGARL